MVQLNTIQRRIFHGEMENTHCPTLWSTVASQHSWSSVASQHSDFSRGVYTIDIKTALCLQNASTANNGAT
ncbi:hypothetical protein L6452_28806 [Arctium lappa]|uniref:Uncharacterized protein n=1 Tax=Arctium lappa TaxID=4217 RepID=A0ACB8ZYX1_ARCLA|nr:hypothetical protein L6452_28806 [Arctium lappa]